MSSIPSFSNSFLKVDLNAICENAHAIHQNSPAQQLIPVLKSNAYGLGSIAVATVLSQLPFVSCFAVAQVQEGLQLKQNKIRQDVLILSHALPQQIEAAVRSDLTFTIGSVPYLFLIANAAKKLGKTAKIQIKFDTGLCRTGFEPDVIPSLIDALHKTSESIQLAGAYSHFADPEDASRCAAQYRLFCSLSDLITDAGFELPLRHICDSAASEYYPQYALNALRIGRRLAFGSPKYPDHSIMEAASLYSFVTDIHSRKKGSRLGYDSGIVLMEDKNIASIGIGYGDGLDPHIAAHDIAVLINGRLCPVLYCFMDQLLVDITGVSAQIGDQVTLFGHDDLGNFLSAQAQAKKLNALEGCALTTALLPRVERVY